MQIVSVAWKVCTREQRKEQNCFGSEITGTKVTNLKPDRCGSSGSDEDAGFTIEIFSVMVRRVYRMMRPVVSLHAVKIDKCNNHLLNFPAVTLRGLLLFMYKYVWLV
jgi:hypothetical protein